VGDERGISKGGRGIPSPIGGKGPPASLQRKKGPEEKGNQKNQGKPRMQESGAEAQVDVGGKRKI